MFIMGLHDPFGHLKHKVMAKRKGRESNWQFGSQPLKVRNRTNFLACRCRATYCWKSLDEGYNFAFVLTSIRSLYTKLWASKVTGVSILGVCPVARHIIYYKGEGDGSPQV
jgi:hypothetical protein